ncbi:hypothetical protein T4D_2312 [Trichinella pseudospiralis]|uniref:Uncharacterized protein n=1 Tax=Trichinella pseudospiralis TaxID=6337 RepID=A0A0V1G357_TRIPS|nr:hypothetical protein T4D_2312 [Trichinella pseudospiralis]
MLLSSKRITLLIESDTTGSTMQPIAHYITSDSAFCERAQLIKFQHFKNLHPQLKQQKMKLIKLQFQICICFQIDTLANNASSPFVDDVRDFG